MAKTKKFRIATEGATVDGRVIDRAWLEQMAASYDPATYTARINCEHIAGFSPDKPFNAYGSVLSLSAEEVDLNIGGKSEKRLALFAEIEANDQLVAINKAGQKLFTSCEIHPDFAGTKKAYLIGLAVTDTPASLGTEPLKFAAMSRPNLFTLAEETAIELIEDTAGDDAKGAFASMKSFFDRLGAANDKPKPAVVTPPEKPANDNIDLAALTQGMGLMAASLTTLATKFDASTAALRGEVTTLNTKLAAFQTKLAGTEAPGFTRQPATGGNGTHVTDC